MDSLRFDGLVKAMAAKPTASRRSIAGGLMVILLSGAGHSVAAAKRGNGKGKGKGKGKRTNKPSKPRPRDVCDTTWSDAHNRDYCRFIRRQCDGSDPREFCIIEGELSDPSRIAVCCELGETCCGDECCAPPRHCCNGKKCCAETQTCCGDGCAPKDDPVLKCCGGRVYNTAISPQHCGVCGNACAADEVCRDGECACEGPDCGCRNCPAGQTCVNGRCGCHPGYKYCPLATRCVNEQYECCGGLPIGYCFPPFPCCGSGIEAFCSPYLTCP